MTRFSDFTDQELNHIDQGIALALQKMRENKVKPSIIRETTHLQNELYQEIYKRNRGGN